MRLSWIAALATALFAACAPHARAVSFLPVVKQAETGALGNADLSGAGLAPAGEPTLPPSRIRVGTFAAFWKVPEVDISRSTGYAGDAVRFATTTMPVIEVDGRVGPRLRLGAWYNPLDTHVWLKGPSADLLAAQGQPVGTDLGRVSLNMWNIHATYQLPWNSAVALGVTRYQGSLDLWVQDPRRQGNMHVASELGATEVSLWGYHSERILSYQQKLAYFTGGLGACHRISHEEGSPGNELSLEASASVAYFPWERISLNASVWATDLTDHRAFTTRVSTGITGHF